MTEGLRPDSTCQRVSAPPRSRCFGWVAAYSELPHGLFRRRPVRTRSSLVWLSVERRPIALGACPASTLSHGLPIHFSFGLVSRAYRTAPNLQALDYTPGRDADPYRPEEFEDRELQLRVGRSVVGAQGDIGASGALSGAFVISDPADPWLPVSQRLLGIGADAAAAGGLPLLAVLPVRLGAFESGVAQQTLVRAFSAKVPAGWYLLADGLSEESSVDRILAALEMASRFAPPGPRSWLAEPAIFAIFYGLWASAPRWDWGDCCASRSLTSGSRRAGRDPPEAREWSYLHFVAPCHTKRRAALSRLDWSPRLIAIALPVPVAAPHSALLPRSRSTMPTSSSPVQPNLPDSTLPPGLLRWIANSSGRFGSGGQSTSRV